MLPKFSILVAKQGNVPSERRFCFILSIGPICRSNSWGSVLGTRSSRKQQLCFSAVVRQWVVCSRVNEGNANQPLCFPLGQRADRLLDAFSKGLFAGCSSGLENKCLVLHQCRRCLNAPLQKPASVCSSVRSPQMGKNDSRLLFARNKTFLWI